MFSNRTDWHTEENELSKTLGNLRAQNISYIDLTESNPTRCRFDYLKPELLNQFLDSDNLKYDPSPFGCLKARETIAHYYKSAHGISISVNQIILTSGTSEAYAHLFKLMLNQNESILAPKPSYPLLEFLSDLHDINHHTYHLDFESGWLIDRDDLVKQSLKIKPKALIVIHPNNPTGTFISQKELQQLNAAAKAQNACLIADEVFLDYTLDTNANPVPSFTSNQDILTFTLSGISKVLGLPQMKLSWIVVSGPKAVTFDACKRLEIIADTFLSPSTPIQNSLVDWMKQRTLIQNEIKGRLQTNLQTLRTALKSQSCIKALPVEGGWNAILRIPGVEDDLNFCLELLETERVLIQPGYFYDFDSEGFFVISLLCEPSAFTAGIEQMIRFAGAKIKITKT